MTNLGYILPLLSTGQISGLVQVGSPDPGTIGSIFYPTSNLESSVNVTLPLIFQYPYGDSRRYVNGTDALNANTVFANSGASAVLGSPVLPLSTGMSNGAPLSLGIQYGLNSNPTTNGQPVVSVTKYSSAALGPQGYEGGAAWFSTYRKGGTADTVGLTGFTEVDGGTASAVAIHGFAVNTVINNAGIWSGWFTSNDLNSTSGSPSQCVSSEHDIVLGYSRSHVVGNVVPGQCAVGIIINNQSDELGNFHGTAGLVITGESNAKGLGFTSQWYTGILCQGNTIVPGDANEFIQINGGLGTSTTAHCGIRTTQTSFFTHLMDLSGWITGAVTSTALTLHPIFQPDVTTLGIGYFSSLSTQPGSYTLSNLRCFEAAAGTIGAGSTVTNQVGFYADSSLTGASANFGFYSNLPSAAGNWNIYSGGTAQNFFQGDMIIAGGAQAILHANTTVTSGAGSSAGTLTNAPAAGNPTKWIPFNDAGTTRFIPAW